MRQEEAEKDDDDEHMYLKTCVVVSSSPELADWLAGSGWLAKPTKVVCQFGPNLNNGYMDVIS